jgi:hypothetical protein
MERSTLFIQTNSSLFTPSLESLAAIHRPADSCAPLCVQDLHIRRERQTFLLLPETGAIVFTVRTYMRPLVDVDGDELRALWEQVSGWAEDMARYKSRQVWNAVLETYCRERLGRI